MGEMRRAIAREEDDRRKQDRFASTLVIAASIIAAVRLARDDISRPSPRAVSDRRKCTVGKIDSECLVRWRDYVWTIRQTRRQATHR